MKKICLLFLLYCNINTFSKCCDYCCDEDNDSGGVKKKTEWEYFKKYNTPKKRADAWKNTLSRNGYKDDSRVVPVVWEQHDKKKGSCFSEIDEASVMTVNKYHNVKTIYDNILVFSKEHLNIKLKHLVIYFNVDPNLKYDGTQTTLGEKLISDEDFLFDKNSDDPILKRTVCVSYYAEKNS